MKALLARGPQQKVTLEGFHSIRSFWSNLQSLNYFFISSAAPALPPPQHTVLKETNKTKEGKGNISHWRRLEKQKVTVILGWICSQ